MIIEHTVRDPYPVIVDRDKVLAFIRDLGFESSSVHSFFVDQQTVTIKILRKNDDDDRFPASDDEAATATITIPLTGHCEDCDTKINRRRGFCDACRDKRQNQGSNV